MAEKARRYTVSGIDDQGDVHSYHTDRADFAEAMEAQMAEELNEVELIDNEAG